MISKPATALMRLSLLMSLLLPMLSACAIGPRGISCPKLAPPPESAVDALEADAKIHPESGDYLIVLERHYRNLDICRGL